MYRQPSKRQVILQRIAVYGLMIVSVVALVTILIFIMLGYQFNRSDGKIEQGGLVQFESRPSGADVMIDGAAFGSQTTTKATLTAGEHFIKMQRDGYRAWQKSVKVVPGSVLWLNYARLIPNSPKSSNVAELAAASSAASSDDNKWMAIKEDPATPVIRLADLSNDKVKLTNLELPATSYTHPSDGKTQTFTLEEWDPDSRYLLVRHVYDDTKKEWMVMDTRDVSETKNITTSLGINATKVKFSNGNSAVLYALTDTNDVRRIDLGATTLSGPLLTNIADFSLYDNSIIAYVSLLDPTTKARTAGYLEEGADKPRTLRSYSDDGTPPLHLVIDKYFDDTYAAISYGDSIDILVGELPKDDKPSLMKSQGTLTVPGGIQHLTTKTNGRFVVAQAGAAFTVYDMELGKMTTTTTKGVSEVTKEFDWLDSYMPWSDRDGMLRFYEFDGANQHDIMPVVPGLSVTLSLDSKYVYGIAKSDDGKFHLARTQLILN
jgi:PEGA domain-containing protein